jgi:hypothetical protein
MDNELTEQFLDKLARNAYLRLHNTKLSYQRRREKYRKIIAQKCEQLKSLVGNSGETLIEKIDKFQDGLCDLVDEIGIEVINNSDPRYNIVGPEHQMKTIYYFLNERSLSSLKRTLRQILCSIERFQKKPDGNDNTRVLTKAHRLAYNSYEYAIKTNPKLADAKDRDVYNWLRENGSDEENYQLPSFETWLRYIGKGRTVLGTQKNTRCYGKTGRSIVKATEI